MQNDLHSREVYHFIMCGNLFLGGGAGSGEGLEGTDREYADRS